MSETASEWQPPRDVTKLATIQMRPVGNRIIEFTLTSDHNPDLHMSEVLRQVGRMFRLEAIYFNPGPNNTFTAGLRLVPDKGVVRVFLSDDVSPAAPLASEPTCDARPTLPSESLPPPGDPLHP